MDSLGINIGSSSLKIVGLEKNEIAFSSAVAHDGDFTAALQKIVKEGDLPEGTPTLVTGTEGRFLFKIDNIIEPLCIEAALDHLKLEADAVVAMGGEDLIVYAVDTRGKLSTTFPGASAPRGPVSSSNSSLAG